MLKGSPPDALKDNMADEFEELELVSDEAEVQKKKEDKRLKDLSEKVRLTAEERDEKEKLLQEQSAKLEAAEKEKEFYKNFNTLTAKYPGASDYQDAIKEKVNAGYDPDDAAVAVLAREGKLPGQTQSPVAEAENPAGGSAANTIKGEGEKSPSEMTQEERRAELLKNEGELNNILYPSR